MLPAEERLRRASVFQRAYKKRCIVSTPVLSLYVLPRQGAEGGKYKKSLWRPLVGFVVAKKVSKSACKRNLAKRRLREAYRLKREEAYAQGNSSLRLDQWYTLVFVAQPQIVGASYKDIAAALHSVLVRADKKFGAGQRLENAPKL